MMGNPNQLVIPGNLNFLAGVYKHECQQVRNSPEQAAGANLAQARRVADKLLTALNVYGHQPGDRHDETRFPTLELDDPCQNLPCLPISLWDTNNGWLGSKNVLVSYSPAWLDPAERPPLGFSLGVVTVDEPYTLHGRETPASISELSLYRRYGNGRGPKLEECSGWQEGKGFVDGYTVNPEAMNFIGLIGQYLEKLDKNRLILAAPLTARPATTATERYSSSS